MEFFVHISVGKPAKRLCLLGSDALLPDRKDDARMILTTLRDGRMMLTRDKLLLDWGSLLAHVLGP
jgi:uncharacterized protein with PIN domain